MQINLHVGRNISDPDHRDADGPDHQTIKTLSDFIRKWLPGIEDKPSVLETCLYTVRSILKTCLYIVRSIHKNMMINPVCLKRVYIW